MIQSRSTRRLPAWNLRDILPEAESDWRQIALVCLGLSTILGLFVGILGYIVGVWVYAEYRDGSWSPAAFMGYVLLYGAFVASPLLGWIFAARGRFRSASIAASFSLVLFVGFLLTALFSQ